MHGAAVTSFVIGACGHRVAVWKAVYSEQLSPERTARPSLSIILPVLLLVSMPKSKARRAKDRAKLASEGAVGVVDELDKDVVVAEPSVSETVPIAKEKGHSGVRAIPMAVPPAWRGVCSMPGTDERTYGDEPLGTRASLPEILKWEAQMVKHTQWPEKCDAGVRQGASRAVAQQVMPYLQDYGQFRHIVGQHLADVCRWQHHEVVRRMEENTSRVESQGRDVDLCLQHVRELRAELRTLRRDMSELQEEVVALRTARSPRASGRPRSGDRAPAGWARESGSVAHQPRAHPLSPRQVSDMIAAAQSEARRSRSSSPHPLCVYSAPPSVAPSLII